MSTAYDRTSEEKSNILHKETSIKEQCKSIAFQNKKAYSDKKESGSIEHGCR
jgi:hypothetical protein